MRLGLEAQLLCQLRVRRFHQDLSIRKNDGRDGPLAFIDLLDEFDAFGIVIDIYIGILDALLTEELLGALAVRAPDCSVNHDG